MFEGLKSSWYFSRVIRIMSDVIPKDTLSMLSREGELMDMVEGMRNRGMTQECAAVHVMYGVFNMWAEAMKEDRDPIRAANWLYPSLQRYELWTQRMVMEGKLTAALKAHFDQDIGLMLQAVDDHLEEFIEQIPDPGMRAALRGETA